jgi:peroxiredoxin
MEKLVVGMTAPDVKLRDQSGQERVLADVWSGGPTLLTFLRHFG